MIQAQNLFHDPARIKTMLTFGQIEPFLFKKRLSPTDFLNEQVRKASRICGFRAMKDGMEVMSAALTYTIYRVRSSQR